MNSGMLAARARSWRSAGAVTGGIGVVLTVVGLVLGVTQIIGPGLVLWAAGFIVLQRAERPS